MKIIRQLITIPLIILRDLLSVIPIYNKLEVMRWICLVNDSSDNAMAYISALIAAYGPADFEQAAIEQMHKHKDARFATAVGMAYYEAGQFGKSKQMLETALSTGCGNEYELLMLSFLHCSREDASELDAIIDQMLERKDLSPGISQLAWTFKCWSLVEKRKFEQAAAMADRILAIEANGFAFLVKWIVTFNVNPPLAAGYFTKAEQVWRHPYFEASVAQGWHLLGKAKEAAEYLHKAKLDGFQPHKSDEIFNEIMNSEQYRQG